MTDSNCGYSQYLCITPEKTRSHRYRLHSKQNSPLHYTLSSLQQEGCQNTDSMPGLFQRISCFADFGSPHTLERHPYIDSLCGQECSQILKQTLHQKSGHRPGKIKTGKRYSRSFYSERMDVIIFDARLAAVLSLRTAGR